MKIETIWTPSVNTKHLNEYFWACVYLGCADGIQGLWLQLLSDVRHRVGYNHRTPVERVLHSLKGNRIRPHFNKSTGIKHGKSLSCTHPHTLSNSTSRQSALTEVLVMGRCIDMYMFMVVLIIVAMPYAYRIPWEEREKRGDFIFMKGHWQKAGQLK